MTTVSAPFGFRPVKNQAAQVRPTLYRWGILSTYSTALYQGQPVKLVAASVNGATSNFIQAASASEAILGIFQGVEYTDSNGRRQVSKTWTASLAYNTNQPLDVWVWDDPNTIFEAQADGAIATQTTSGAPFYGFWGAQIDSVNVTSGSSVYQLSGAGLDHTTIVTSASAKQWQIVDKGFGVDNEWFDTYPILRVKIAKHQLLPAPPNAV